MVNKAKEKPRVLAICGNAGAGKDSIASLIQKLYYESEQTQYDLGRVCALADPLKSQAAQLLGVPIDTFYSEEGKKSLVPGTDKTFRDFLVDYSAVIKKYQPDVWCRKMLDTMVRGNYINVITDMRTEFEYNYFAQHAELITIRVTRNNLPYPAETYSSAMELQASSLPYTYLVENNGSLEELKERVKEVFAEIFGSARRFKQLHLLLSE